MTTRVKVGLGIAVPVIGLIAWGLLTWPGSTVGQVHGGSVDLATCRIVEAEDFANSRGNEGDPPVGPVPASGQLFACNALFPDSQSLATEYQAIVANAGVVEACLSSV
jgi:hypothetical protein